MISSKCHYCFKPAKLEIRKVFPMPLNFTFELQLESNNNIAISCCVWMFKSLFGWLLVWFQLNSTGCRNTCTYFHMHWFTIQSLAPLQISYAINVQWMHWEPIFAYCPHMNNRLTFIFERKLTITVRSELSRIWIQLEDKAVLFFYITSVD